ncbi:MAG: division plane positioning ATPase MipZ [Alphaproteobacteria bacterium]
MGDRAHVIVLGNEKGGSGKSTTAMQLFVALARAGQRVGALDLDLRQQSFFRYLDNREAHGKRIGAALSMPRRIRIGSSSAALRDEAAAADRDRLTEAVAGLSHDSDFIIIDTPGAVTELSEAAHTAADTLITPINDSLIDFDLLGRVDPVTGKVKGPSVYSEMVWSARQRRAVRRENPIDWVVLRNRMAMLESRNKRRVGTVMAELSRRIGFRIAPGFSERVVFRELFLTGLTLLDLKKDGPIPLTMSHVAARQEVRDLMKALNLPGVGPEDGRDPALT